MRRPARRRVAVDGTRRVVTGEARSQATLVDDEPLEILPSRDGKRIFVVLPYEIWILDAKSLAAQRTIELSSATPSLAEDADGVLWIGGHHLFRASLWNTALEKVGARLGGFVDRVTLLRPGLLCGAGHHGELLWDTQLGKEVHRRRVREHRVYGLLATLDERALWCDGAESGWLINPSRTSGYTQLRFPTTSSHSVADEGIVAVGQTTRGRCILGSRDGGVAWTHTDLRLAAERFPALSPSARWPHDIAGDERWIYALRGRGLLQRFRIEDPKPPRNKDDARPSSRRPHAEPPPDEPPPDPPAQSCRLDAPASCLALVQEDGVSRLLLGGPRADGHLGRVWRVDPQSLDWTELELGHRETVPPPEAQAPSAPSFAPTRNKLDGIALRDLKVDDVLSLQTIFWLVRDHANPLDQPIGRVEPADVLGGDALVLPAMMRFAEGTARPGLVVLSPSTAPNGNPVAPRLLAWGDEMRGWLRLTAPALREQKWPRTDVFPLGIALASPAPVVAGRRAAVPKTWVDRDLFIAMAKECKRLLKVLW
ncbi:MAG: hypothetical protein B7733_03600 [Myxococcales bacterium FL481]|nr:MAG: hypothetical protein B7733_03600 [Myxococcales bacterium FL481]